MQIKGPVHGQVPTSITCEAVSQLREDATGYGSHCVNFVYMYIKGVSPDVGNMHPNNPSPVVSVRLDRAVLDALDGLVARTQRSRGFYLREAITEQLPKLLERYWAQEATDRHDEETDKFNQLMAGLLGEISPKKAGQ